MTLYETAHQISGDRNDFGPCDDDWKFVRRVEATSTNGRGSTIYVRRMPAHFWRLVSGDIEITTGSGGDVATLLELVADALAAGMIRLRFGGADLTLTGVGKAAMDLIAAFERERAREMVGFGGL